MAQPAETVLHRWFEEVWNQGRESSIDELMADGALIHGIATPNGKPMRGAADFKPFHRQFRAAFPDMRITVEDMLVDGDKLAARCSVTATPSASLASASRASPTARSQKAGTTSISSRYTNNSECN